MFKKAKPKEVLEIDLEQQKFIDEERQKIQDEQKVEFVSKKFLEQDDLGDLKHYKINQIERELDLMSEKIHFKHKTADNKKKTKNPENMLTQVLIPILISILVYIIVCACVMLVISASIINSLSLVIQKSQRPKVASFLMTYAVFLVFHSSTLIKFIKSFHAKHLKIGSLLFILTFFLNILPLSDVVNREYKVNELVTEFLWSGIEYKEDTSFIAAVQIKYKCCGVFNWTDWRLNRELNYRADIPYDKIKLHMTCCREDANEIIFCIFERNFHKKNCRNEVLKIFTYWLRFLVIFFAFLQLSFGLAAVFGYVLAKNYQIIKHHDYITDKLNSVRSIYESTHSQ